MDRKNIILLSGKQGSGKTTLANRLLKALPGSKLIKFADPLYEMQAACLPILKEYGLRPTTMEKDGELLQILGTEYGRKKLGENVWSDVAASRAATFHVFRKHDWVVIDDCRFENEFDAFPTAWRFRLECPKEVRQSRCSYWREADEHPSETGLDAYAADNKFYMTLHTGHMPIELCVKYILTEIGTHG